MDLRSAQCCSDEEDLLDRKKGGASGGYCPPHPLPPSMMEEEVVARWEALACGTLGSPWARAWHLPLPHLLCTPWAPFAAPASAQCTSFVRNRIFLPSPSHSFTPSGHCPQQPPGSVGGSSQQALTPLFPSTVPF